MSQRPATPAVKAKCNQAAAEAIERIRSILIADGNDFRAIRKAIDDVVDAYDDQCFDLRTEGRL